MPHKHTLQDREPPQDSSTALCFDVQSCRRPCLATLPSARTSRRYSSCCSPARGCKQRQRATAGLMTAVLRTERMEHAIAFATWLQRHAGLLQELEVQLHANLAGESNLEPAIKALAGAMFQQQKHMQRLQRFTLRSSFWAAGILLQLPISLKMLDLSGTSAAKAGRVHALAPIERLQQLTELRLGLVQPCQLRAFKLPRLLQHLDMTVAIDYQPLKLSELARWLGRYGRRVRHLGLCNMSARLMFNVSPSNWEKVLWLGAMEDVAYELQVAAATPQLALAPPPPPPATDKLARHTADSAAAAAAAEAPAAAAAEAAAAAAPAKAPRNAGSASCSSSGLQLQSLQCCPPAMPLPGPVLQQLPASTLTQLVCSLEFDKQKHLLALYSLTALRSLELLSLIEPTSEQGPLVSCSSHVLSHMSDLQQLTALKLPCVTSRQLVHLQLPQLQELAVNVHRGVYGYGQHAEQQQQQEQGEHVQASTQQQHAQLELRLVHWFVWVEHVM